MASSPEQDLDQLDSFGAPAPFMVRLGGADLPLAAAPALSWRHVLVAGYNVPALVELSFPDGPPDVFAQLAPWKTEKIGWAWRAHYGLPQDAEDAYRLVRLVARYWRPLEIDLLARQLDLTVEWRARRWRRLLNVIEYLPRATAYMEAVSDDEDLAWRLLERPETPPMPPRVREWSPVVELLTAVLDRVSELIQVTAGAAGAKPGPVRPAPRPVTALDRVRAVKRQTTHRRIVAKLLPDKEDHSES